MTQTKSALPVAYQRGSTLNSTTLYKGGLFSFLVKGEDSGGRDAMIEYRAKPGNEPAPYLNQWEHETYYVLEGVMEFYCGDSEVMVVNAGEMVFLPQGKAHAFYIRSPQVRALILVQAVGEHAVGLVGVASQNEHRHLMAMGTPATSMELPTDAITDEFIDPGDSIRVGATNGIRFLASGENINELPHYPGFKFKRELVGEVN
ncbi:cupin domain-containing protein [Chamaesiphon sp. VAR_48_metabat_135_sub]|uniref:cupin domain-containing protein n=1 Tax=Chamaesiphon sp. VAR_48_metabat_135_sub TaxID=2964699 RepID=UPI00286A0643|nr:cupin domain-containing protein [Chamaesiphon sp. VAR_48_metabat_135_sub]